MSGPDLPNGDDRWPTFQEHLRRRVPASTWATWLAALRPETDGEGVITVLAPSEFHLHWILDKHREAVQSAFVAVYGADVVLSFAAGATTPPPDDDLPPPLPEIGHQPELPMRPEQLARLVHRYRFDSFVVGQSNRFAYAAAMAVAEKPGVQYNPLFIYGAAGLGKTHLLNAIGHGALEMYPDLSVRYVSSETFFNEFIDGIRRKRMDDFKHRYRTTDILLLDDVQFFEGKEQILEEFFHTFNSLHEAGKQLVISSDRHPRHLSRLEDRLRTRFEWGLLTDIQPPDVETRLAILKHNSEMSPVVVPMEVLEFIAAAVSDNIRELEGAFTRVTALAALTNQRLDLDMAREVLSDLQPPQTARVLDGSRIVATTAAFYGYSQEELLSKSRRAPLAMSRQIGMYLCRELTDLSLPKIAAIFNRDHTTVMHGVEKVAQAMRSDRTVYDQVVELSHMLRKTAGNPGDTSPVLPKPRGRAETAGDNPELLPSPWVSR